MKEMRIVLVTRETRLEELVRKYNTRGQARFYLEHLGQDFSDYLGEHDEYKRQAGELSSYLGSRWKLIGLDRKYLSTFLFDESDVIYVLGRDGLVANTLKYLDGQPVVGINPDRKRWAGVLLPFSPEKPESLNPERLLEKGGRSSITLGKAEMNDGQILYGVNDFFIGRRTHVSSRYEIEYRGMRERQSSSGIIVSTGTGSTGWLKSVLAGASRIAREACHPGLEPVDDASFPGDADYMRFAVREPYISPDSGADLVYGTISGESPLKLTSAMAEEGVIFSDGMEKDFLDFTSGKSVTLGMAEKKASLILPP